MLGRYVLKSFIRNFLVVMVLFLSILLFYTGGEFFFLFKDKSVESLVHYVLNTIPIAFFYISPFFSGLAVLTSYRRLLRKRIDLLSQSFGLSPLKLSFHVLAFVSLISLFNALGSYEFYPRAQKNLFRIEKSHKKAKELETGVVRNLWLTDQMGEQRTFLNFGVVDLSQGSVYSFYLLRVGKDSMEQLITAELGRWQGERIELKDAKITNLVTGEETIKNMSLSYIDIRHIQPLAERADHLPLLDLFMLSLMGEKMGINQRYYSYEIWRRIFSSLLPFSLTVIVLWFYLRSRQFSIGMVAMISVFSYHWLSLNLIKSTVENTDLSLSLSLLLYAPLLLTSLKGLHDLSKGFRV